MGLLCCGCSHLWLRRSLEHTLDASKDSRILKFDGLSSDQHPISAFATRPAASPASTRTPIASPKHGTGRHIALWPAQSLCKLSQARISSVDISAFGACPENIVMIDDMASIIKRNASTMSLLARGDAALLFVGPSRPMLSRIGS